MEIVGCQGHSPALDDQAAVEHLTLCPAAELAVDGIRVNAVAPGPAATSIHATLGDDINKVHEDLLSTVPCRPASRPLCFMCLAVVVYHLDHRFQFYDRR
jgi:NAD(P)-dependent dehydrogenase (short-subunit alcohol dehydrogenase family)